MADTQTPQPGWRRDAAKIVEDLFAAAPRETWDALLDLRGLLLSGRDWPAAIALFIECRARLEDDNYLPFYRLRRLLAASLRLEGEQPGALRRLLASARPGPRAAALAGRCAMPGRVIETAAAEP